MAVVSVRDKQVTIEIGKPTVIIGERINPTGKPKLTAELQKGNLDLVEEEALLQRDAGADIIDVNVGAPGVDEIDLLPQAVLRALEAAQLPICIDSSNRDALVAALEVYPGVALVNSVNGEEEVLKRILPAIKKHNAVVVGLTMDDVGIPTDPDKRFEIAKKIVERAQEEGIPKENILIDCLAMAVSADPNAGIACLKAIGRVTEELGVCTTLGASNISFGMPNRNIINKAFLSMAIMVGLTSAIVDPTKEEVVRTILASDFLMSRDPYGARYLKNYRQQPKYT